jgi:hypothetical protein
LVIIQNGISKVCESNILERQRLADKITAGVQYANAIMFHTVFVTNGQGVLARLAVGLANQKSACFVPWMLQQLVSLCTACIFKEPASKM